MIGQSDSVATALVLCLHYPQEIVTPRPPWHSHKKSPDTLPVEEWETNAKVNAVDDNISPGQRRRENLQGRLGTWVRSFI